KNVVVDDYMGIKYNKVGKLSANWATQLVMYGWLLGVPVGVPFVGGIEELVGYDVRICQHRVMISGEFGLEVWNKCVDLWERIQGKKEWCDDPSLEEKLTTRALGAGGFVGW